MQDAKEEVRSRLNIEDVIGEYVQLKRAGRNFKGLSPFSGEKTPSFFVSPEKQIWHDFSSNKGGDIYSFIMEVEGLDFRGALENLARRAGVDLSVYDTAKSRTIAKQKQRLLEANKWAARYFQESLLRNKHALEYATKSRGLNKHIVQTFQVGYAPDSGKALVDFLTKKGFSAKELSAAGLTNRFGGDLFRGRITIPLMDESGQVIGFTGRVLKDEPNSPKYLNTPQTLIYDKSRHVFGLFQAKQAIRQSDYAVMVEGNMDVIASHQAGIEPVVAAAGTALTEQHLKSLVRLSSNIKLAFDADKAGLSATERAIGIAQNVGVELTIVEMPDNAKDPDELIKQDKSKWQLAIDSSMPAVDWVIDQYAKREDLTTAAGKKRFSDAVVMVIAKLDDSIESDHYLARVAEMTGASKKSVEEKLSKNQVDSLPKQLKTVKSQTIELVPKMLHYQDNLLALAMLDSGVRDLMTDLSPDFYYDESRSKVAEYLLKFKTKAVSDTPRQLQEFDTYVKILTLKAETRYLDWSAEDRRLEASRLVRSILIDYKKQQKHKLDAELQQAEASQDEEKASELRIKINQIIKEIRDE